MTKIIVRLTEVQANSFHGDDPSAYFVGERPKTREAITNMTVRMTFDAWKEAGRPTELDVEVRVP